MSQAATRSKRILVASDHAAVPARAIVIDELKAQGFDVRDLGPADTTSVDYPDYAEAVARGVAAGEADQGVLLCGTGIGMSIAANKVDGIRAALVHDVTGAHLAREHNDANVLVLGGAVLGDRLIRDIVRTWIQTGFEGGRHQKRVDKIERLELSRGHAPSAAAEALQTPKQPGTQPAAEQPVKQPVAEQPGKQPVAEQPVKKEMP